MCLIFAVVGMDFKIHSQFRARTRLQRIVGAGNIRLAQRARAFNRNAHAAFAKFVTAGSCCAQAESSLAPFQVRNTHPRK